jgi:hypothetical protein
MGLSLKHELQNIELLLFGPTLQGEVPLLKKSTNIPQRLVISPTS